MYTDDRVVGKLINAGKKRPAVPPIPETLEDCEKLIEQEFKTIHTSEPVATMGGGFGTGGESASMKTLGCPFCGFEFNAIHRYGCFHSIMEPHECPNCRFPTNLLFGILSKVKQQKTSD